MSELQKKRKGLSLRWFFSLLIVLSIVIAGILALFTIQLTDTFKKMNEASALHIKMEQAAYDLMDASDYLTEKAQRFSLTGDVEFMNDYFTEANETKRREKAVAALEESDLFVDALEDLRLALENSNNLMKLEFHSMKLVVEAKGITAAPVAVRDYALTAEESAKSAEEKMLAATEIVLGNDYYTLKDAIRNKMQSSLAEIKKITKEREEKAQSDLNWALWSVRIGVIVQALAVLVFVIVSSQLGISPLITAIDKIKEDKPLPEMGANEFRYLARTYNKMYEVYKKSIENLNFKASHDELTGVYNRSGYELLLTTLDIASGFMILVDIDDFKKINDTYGHVVGDKVLIKISSLLKNSFRADDYVCRLGGDEFAVLMQHVSEAQSQLISEKINQMNNTLGEPKDGLPAFSISAGIAHGGIGINAEKLYHNADKALYATKRNGKKGYTFFTKE